LDLADKFRTPVLGCPWVSERLERSSIFGESLGPTTVQNNRTVSLRQRSLFGRPGKKNFMFLAFRQFQTSQKL